MNIAVCIKQTPDTETRVQIAGDGKSIAEEDIQWIINPYDESAIEQALVLTEEQGGEVTLISLGPDRIEKSIREGLAMGAQKAIRLNVDRIPADSLTTANALAETLKEGGYDLIFLGQQAVDDDNAQIPQMIGQALGLPCVTAVEELDFDGNRCKATRVLEGYREVVGFNLPAVIGVNRRLVEPRYPSFKGIMQAKRKKIDVVDASLSQENLVIEKLNYPEARGSGKLYENGVEAVPEVVRLLREEAKVI